MSTDTTDTMDLAPLLTAIRLRWRTFSLIMILTVCASVVYAFLSPKWYRAEAVVVAVDAKSLPGGLSQLSGLASLAGVNLSRGDSSQPLAVLKSRSLLRDFINEEGLLPVLFSRDWDASSKRWRVDAGAEPTLDDAVDLFDESIREVIEDRKSGTITIRLAWFDRDLAAQWANALVQRANARLREQALRDAEKNVTYLKREIAESQVVSLQESLGQVLESELQKLLLAKGNSEYAFRTVDPATPPARHYRPARALIILFGGVLGFCLGVIGALLRQRYSDVVA